MKTNVYIDGFNLCHRALQDTPYKWLDLSKLCQALLPKHTINSIRYFTALVEHRPQDPGQQRRQSDLYSCPQDYSPAERLAGSLQDGSTAKAPNVTGRVTELLIVSSAGKGLSMRTSRPNNSLRRHPYRSRLSSNVSPPKISSGVGSSFWEETQWSPFSNHPSRGS